MQGQVHPSRAYRSVIFPSLALKIRLTPLSLLKAPPRLGAEALCEIRIRASSFSLSSTLPGFANHFKMIFSWLAPRAHSSHGAEVATLLTEDAPRRVPQPGLLLLLDTCCVLCGHPHRSCGATGGRLGPGPMEVPEMGFLLRVWGKRELEVLS